jgi:hypothetical protein
VEDDIMKSTFDVYVEDHTMKSTFSVTALGSLMLVLAATASGPATSAPFLASEQEPSFLLAEGGATRLLQMQTRRDQRRDDNASREESQRFTDMLILQPAAAGPQVETEDAQSIDGSTHQQNMNKGGPGRAWLPEH